MNEKKFGRGRNCRYIIDGMIVGLGTGSTVYYIIF